jgi:hypothetical protein
MNEEEFKERNRKMYKKVGRKVIITASGGENTLQGFILKRMFKKSDEKKSKESQ